LLLSLPLVPKHDVCPDVHESLVSGAAGEYAVDLAEDEGEDDQQSLGGAQPGDDAGKPNPFAALEALKRDGDGSDGGKKH